MPPGPDGSGRGLRGELMGMNNRRTGLVLSYASTFLNMACGLLLSSVLLRALGDFEYGLYQTMSAFVNYLVIFEFGTGTVLCRNLLVAQKSEDPAAKKKITATLWYITLLLAVLISAVGLGFLLNIQNIYAGTIPLEQMHYAKGLFGVLLIYLLLSFFTQTLSGAFLGNENYTVGNLINVGKVLLRTAMILVAVYSVKLSIVVALTDAALSLLILLFSLVYVKKKYEFSLSPRYFDKQVLKDSLPLCFAILLQAIVNQANNNVDKFVISIKMNMESVSLYSIAMYVYNMFSSLTTIPISMYMPQVAQSMGQGVKGSALRDSLIPSGRLIALVGGTTLFGFAAVGRQFIEIVYGRQYLLAWLAAIIIMLPMLINMTGGCVVNVLDVLNKRQIRSYILIGTTALNILLTVWLIDFWGILGAVAATAISVLLGQVLLMNLYYRKALSISMLPLYCKAYRGILLSELLAMAAGGLVAWLIANVYLAFVCGLVVFLAVELACLLLFGFDAREKRQWKGLLVK